MSHCMLIAHKGHNNIIQFYSVAVMTHVIALEAGQSSQGTWESITPVTISLYVYNYAMSGVGVIMMALNMTCVMRFGGGELTYHC